MVVARVAKGALSLLAVVAEKGQLSARVKDDGPAALARQAVGTAGRCSEHVVRVHGADEQ